MAATIKVLSAGSCVSFGYEAESEYAGIVTDHEEKDYFFFQNFKMMLYHCEVSMYIQLYLPWMSVEQYVYPQTVVSLSITIKTQQ
jgi:hypothetical protein